MELIFDEDEVTEEQKKEILRLSKAEKGISRKYLIRSGANLKNLYYAIQGMFGWQNRSAHFFSISDEEFNKLTAQRWGGYRDLCGVLFREPHHRVPSSIMRKFIYKSGRTQSAQGRETCP